MIDFLELLVLYYNDCTITSSIIHLNVELYSLCSNKYNANETRRYVRTCLH